MRRSRAPSIAPGTFFVAQFWADCITNMAGFNLRQAQPAADPDWESQGGHYRVHLENNWIDVPDDAVITEPNRAGRTMLWPMRDDNQISIRCFIPGSMT